MEVNFCLVFIELNRDVIIIATSFIGSYMGVRAVSVVIGKKHYINDTIMIIGGFPNEINVAKGVESLNAYAYIYLAIIVVLGIVGAYVQYKDKNSREEEEEDNEAISSFYKKEKN